MLLTRYSHLFPQIAQSSRNAAPVNSQGREPLANNPAATRHQSIARGVSPWRTHRIDSIQPQRGASTFGLVGYSNNGRPVGAWMQGGIRFQGLTPLAIGLSPVGTKNKNSVAIDLSPLGRRTICIRPTAYPAFFGFTRIQQNAPAR